jgi:prephenate dehydrogenase
LATSEELHLLVQIYAATGHSPEAVKLLLSPSLNEDSRVGQQDPHLLNTLLLQVLELSEQWDESFNVCKKLIERSEYRADDRVWNLLQKAGGQIKT